MASTITPQDLYQKLKSREKITLLDIRDKAVFKRWSLYESVNIPLSDLPKRLTKLPKKTPVVTICERGNDAKRATSILKNAGYTAYTLQGGLKAWNNVYDIVEVTQVKSPLQIIQIKRLGKGCLSYLVIDTKKNTAIIIDPSRHVQIYADELKKRQVKLKAVLDTHIHADHISGARILAKKFRVPYLLPILSEVKFPYKPLQKILPGLFPGTPLVIKPTGGHTQESISIILSNICVFTGDTMFIDAIPRTDLTDGTSANAKLLYKSIMEHLYPLKDNVFMLSSHTPQSMVPGPVRGATMRYVKMFTLSKHAKTEADFLRLQTKNSAAKPGNYQIIKQANITGKMPKGDLDELEFGGNSCAALSVD